MFECVGYAATDDKTPLQLFSFKRRDVGPRDVRIDIAYCGVCHSDLHAARNEWANTVYPCIPGHEIVGYVADAGAEVTRFKKGDRVGVGCLVNSCRECASCKDGLEQYCENGFTLTYNSPDPETGAVTYGGYSRAIVVTEDFVLKVPDNLQFAAVAPLLCAGITTWSPLKHWKVGRGSRVGVVGLGGLGHMALKLAHALGAEVTLFTTSQGKADDARRLGAHHVVISKDAAAMAEVAGTLDLIIDTVSAVHPLDGYIESLKRDGTMVQVGMPEKPLSIQASGLAFKRRAFAGSLIGGIAETQEMLDFCGRHDITSDIEMISVDGIEAAYTRMLNSDVKYRFVIDLKSLPDAA